MVGASHAQLSDIEISVNRNKLDEQKQRGYGETITNREIAYRVTLKNKTFRDIDQIEVKYMIFFDDVEPGSREKAITRNITGSDSAGLIKSHSEYSFVTKPVTLSKTELDGNTYWANGASPRAKDAVSGVWIRAYAQGKIVGEYANPSTVAKKFEWKE